MTRIRVISRSATFAWNPKSLPFQSLIVGTTAQQFDASFSSSAFLELCSLEDIAINPRLDLIPTDSAQVQHRFHKLIWSDCGKDDDNQGLVIGGCDNGLISIYKPLQLSHGESAKIHESQRHSGHVMALDVSSRSKYLCSGGATSEVFIWDLQKPTQPMSPGPKQQPFDQIVAVQWNHQVDHILGTLTVEKALVWDLRKNDGPILSMGDLGARTQWRHLCWHPDEATSLCISSEDDNYPVVQKWDVRFATSPVQHMHFHQRGIVAMSWCPADSDMLVTGGKDHKLYLTNPNSGHFLVEIPYAARHWPHQVDWCEWDPNLIGCASLDGKVTIYSLSPDANSATSAGQQSPTVVSPKLADSFPGADFSHSLDHSIAVPSSVLRPQEPIHLPQIPRWSRPGDCGARFSFGGRLVVFERKKLFDDEQLANMESMVQIKQTITDIPLHNRALELQKALESNQMSDFCELRATQTADSAEQLLWTFLNAQIGKCSRKEYHRILGLDHDQERAYFSTLLGRSYTELVAENREELTTSDHEGSQPELKENTERKEQAMIPLLLPDQHDDIDGPIVRALLAGDMEAMVLLCMDQGRWADAAQLAINTSPRLYRLFLDRYVTAMTSLNRPSSRLLTLLCSERWSEVVDNWPLSDWRRLLCLLLSTAPSNRLSSLCIRLSRRLLASPENHLRASATIVSVVGGNVDLLVQASSSLDIAPEIINLVEQTTAFRWSLGAGSVKIAKIGPQLTALLKRFVHSLTMQGCLDIAWRLVDSVDDDKDDHVCCGYLAMMMNVAFRGLDRVERSFVLVLWRSVEGEQNSSRTSIRCPVGQRIDFGTTIKNDKDLERFVANVFETSQNGQFVDRKLEPRLQILEPLKIPSANLAIQPHTSAAAGIKGCYPGSKLSPLPNQRIHQAMPNVHTFMPTTNAPYDDWGRMNIPPIAAISPRPATTLNNVTTWNGPHHVHQTCPNERSGYQLPVIPQILPPQQQIAPNVQVKQHEQVETPLKPVPNGQLEIVNALEHLAHLCLTSSSTPLVRKRSDDARRKIHDELVVSLREQRLGASTLNNLHRLTQFIRLSDYQNAMALHTEMIQGADFADISPFMTSLKTLIVTANQFDIRYQ